MDDYYDYDLLPDNALSPSYSRHPKPVYSPPPVRMNRGAWHPNLTYLKGEAVRYEGHNYVCTGEAYPGDPPSSGNEYPQDVNEGWACILPPF